MDQMPLRSRPGCRMEWLIWDGRIAGLQVLERWGNLTTVTQAIG